MSCRLIDRLRAKDSLYLQNTSICHMTSDGGRQIALLNYSSVKDPSGWTSL